MTNGSTTTPYPYFGNRSTDLFLSPVVLLIALLIIFGNCLTLRAIHLTPSLQTKTNAFVASLAVADLLVGFSILVYGLWLIPPIRTSMDAVLEICIVAMSTGFMAYAVSILGLLLVAIDRYVFICHPFFYQRNVTTRLISLSLGLIWLIGVVFGYMQFFIYNADMERPECVITSVLPTVYYKHVTPCFYIGPCVVIFVLYFKIVRLAQKQHRAIAQLNRARPSQTAGSKGDKPSMNEASWKGVKMMITVFGVFFVCWTPRVLLYMFSGPEAEKYVPDVIFDITLVMGLLNSGMNFLVYPIHNRQFRGAFKRILCCGRWSSRAMAAENESTMRTVVSTM